MTSAEIAAQLRIARESAGLTQTQLAARLYCTQPRVSAIESGKAGLSVERLTRWATECGCNVLIKKVAAAVDIGDSGCIFW